MLNFLSTGKMSSLKTDKELQTVTEEYLKEHIEMFNALPHPIFIVDLDFNIVFANNAMNLLYADAGDLTDNKCCEYFIILTGPLEIVLFQDAERASRSNNRDLFSHPEKTSYGVCISTY